jgi:arsenate reductase
MLNVLFECVHNSARSQIAEAYLNLLGKGKFNAESAELEPGKLNPNVVAVMQESGIDISHHPTTSVFDRFKEGKRYDAIVTVCDAANSERCLIFPGKTKRLAGSFEDPASFTGSKEEIMEKTRKVRDEIKDKITAFIREAGNLSYWI